MIRTLRPADAQRFAYRTVDAMPSPRQMTFAEFENDRRRQLYDAAKADPKANRATPVFDACVDPDYRFVTTATKPELRFCWTVKRNAAGRFLIFRERHNASRGTTKRDQFEAILDKRAAIAACKLNRNAADEQRAISRARRASRKLNP